MSSKFLLLSVGLFASALFACSSSDTGGGSTTSGTTTSTTSSTTGTGGSGGGGTGGGGQGGGGGAADCSAEADTAACRACCSEQNTAGIDMLQALVAHSCGCDAAAACGTECSAEAFCADPAATPEAGACADCINNLGTTEGCALAVLGDCQADPGCSAGLTCILSCP